MVYDQQDRLVATKDGQNEWLFTKYDMFGRVVYTGLANLGTSRQTVQQTLDNLQGAAASNNAARHSVGFYSGNMLLYYNNVSYPIGFSKVLSVNYYDTYPAGTPTIPASILTQAVLPQDAQANSISTKSMPTASYVKNIEDDLWTMTYTWYDMKGRAIGSHSINHLGGYTKTESELDFAGIVQKNNTFHKRKTTNPEVVIRERYVYTPQHLLLKHYHQVDSQAEELLTENHYNEKGELDNRKVGNNLQSIDYTYNIRGWMTGINAEALNSVNGSGKLFAYDIRYTNPTDNSLSPSKFNGNIAEVNWVFSNNGIVKRYAYRYDNLNRLKDAIFLNPYASIPLNHLNDEKLTYDLNGNIRTLQRNAAAHFSTTPDLIDNLEYSYRGNRLLGITDASQNPTGYEGGGNPLRYDANGNMTEMRDKNIENISYNFLNLPNTFAIEGNRKKMFYTYSADGTKLRKLFNYMNEDGSMFATITEYMDGFHYLTTQGTPQNLYDPTKFAYEQEAFIIKFLGMKPTPSLQFFPTAEGFYDYENKQYIYQYKDHLGNVRISYKNTNGTPQYLDQNDYYPFGMNIPRDKKAVFGTGSLHNYKYNGKELQETGMYDYGARFYMPDIGRWGVIDALSEGRPNMSPYRYSFNNPVNSTDPTGLWEDWVGNTDENGSTTWQWRDDIKNAKQAKVAGFDSYSDGKSNNTYTSISGSEVTLGPNGPGDWTEDFTNVNRSRLKEAIANCAACQQIEKLEQYLFIGVPLVLATGGAGGFALSGEMTAGAIGGRFLTDATVQTAVNFSTNGGNLGNAIGDVNLTKSILAGAGMNYVGNSLISSSTVLSASRQATVINGSIAEKEFATQSVLGVAGGATAKGISGTSTFKGTVVGSYMQTTIRFGQAAGSAVGTVLMSTPKYSTGVAKKIIQ